MAGGAAVGVRIKRAYEPPGPEDGFRALVDRLWPRGVPRQALRIDAWWRELAPSAGLRRWFHADPARWPRFQARCREELDALPPSVVEPALRACARGTVTLLTAARDPERSHAGVLREWLRDAAGMGRSA